jgi:type I restriction enzyme, S subunit
MSVESNIPNGWVAVTLEAVIDSANTGLDAIKRAPIVEEETGVKCFRIQDASQKKKYKYWGNTKVEDKNYQRFKLLKGDILIARTGNTIGVNYLVKEDIKSVFNNGLIRLRVNDKCYYEFLYKIIESNLFDRYVQSIAYGTSTQPNMQINVLLGFDLWLPPIDEQKAIAKILTSFDDKIELLESQNKTLETSAQTIFKEWFCKYQIDDDLPDGWRAGKLGEVVEKSNTGADAIKKAPIVEYDTGIRCLRIGDLSNNRAFDQWGFSKVTDKNFKQFQLKKFDILITRTSILGLNKLIMEDLDSVYNNGLIKVSLIKSINPFFIYGYFRSKYYKDYINMINNDTSTRPNMKIDYLLDFPILFPVKELENKFSDIMESILKKITSNTSQIQTLNKNRDTLLPKLMNGSLRINEFKDNEV